MTTRTPATSPTVGLDKSGPYDTGIKDIDGEKLSSMTETSNYEASVPDIDEVSSPNSIGSIAEKDRLETVIETPRCTDSTVDQNVVGVIEDESGETSTSDYKSNSPIECVDVPGNRPRGLSDPAGRILTCSSQGSFSRTKRNISDVSLKSLNSSKSPTSLQSGSTTTDVAYLMSSLSLLKSHCESSVLVNILAVQRQLIEYMGASAVALRNLAPHTFHLGQPAEYRFYGLPGTVPYDSFVGVCKSSSGSNHPLHKTTEDINAVPFSVNGFAPASPGARPPLPKTSTLLHKLGQDVNISRISCNDFDVSPTLKRRHSLSGADDVAQPASADGNYKTMKAKQLGKHKDRENESVSTEVEDSIYGKIYKAGTYEGMGPPSVSPLSREICYFVNTLDGYSESVYEQKLDVLRKFRVCVETLWPRAQAKPFGSFVTGITLPKSDLDVVICLPKVRREAEPNAPGVLEGRNAIKESWQQKLTQRLMREEWVETSSIRMIPNTAVPVLKFQSKPIFCQANKLVTVSLDVSLEGPGHRGLEAKKLISSISRKFPALRSIVLVLKCFLSRKGLCEPFTGGLSSYVLVLMVARFLQEQSSVTDIGALLLGFLDFYGNHLNPRTTGISFTRGCYFSREVSNVSHPNTGPTVPRQSSFQSIPRSNAVSYSMASALAVHSISGFSSAPMSPAGSVCGDDTTTSYSEDYIGYVHSTPGIYSHHPGGSVIIASGIPDVVNSPDPAPSTSPLTASSNTSESHVVHQQPPLFYKFDPFFLEDPLSPGNNIGRNCFRIYQVQRSWSEALSSVSLQIQRLERLYFEIHDANMTSKKKDDVANFSITDEPSNDLSLLKSLVGDITLYCP